MLALSSPGFTCPAIEVELGPVLPAVRVTNSGTEAALVDGLLRIYRKSTGLLVYSSALIQSTVPAGSSVAVAALTEWLPGAPAVDDYFIDGWLTAVSLDSPESTSWPAYSLDFAITAPPPGPYPDPHAPTHELGGVDPLIGAQFQLLSEKGAADGYAPLPTQLDGTLVVCADGVARVRPLGLYACSDQLNDTEMPPWSHAAIAAGAMATLPGEPNHPGITRCTSGAPPNAGHRMFLSMDSFLIAGSESARLIFRPQSLPQTTVRFGFHDSVDHLDAVDGVYIESVAGLVSGKTATNSARSTTVSNFQTVQGTWYSVLIVLNADASLASFYLYDEAGAELWSDALAPNIPTAAGRETGHGVNSTNVNAGAVDLLDVDFIDVRVARDLVR